MKYNIIHVHHGSISEETEAFTLLQLCNICQLSPEIVIEMVDEGILEPEGERKIRWRFSHEAIECAKKVRRFRHDLNINIAGAALALQLLDRIEQLEALIESRR